MSDSSFDDNVSLPTSVDWRKKVLSIQLKIKALAVLVGISQLYQALNHVTRSKLALYTVYLSNSSLTAVLMVTVTDAAVEMRTVPLTISEIKV